MKQNYTFIHVYNCLINTYKYFASLTRWSFNVVTIAIKQLLAFLLVFLIFSVRFGWIILLLIISEILINFNLIPSYSIHYESIKNRIRRWYTNSTFNLGLLVSSIVAGPYLLETCLYYCIIVTKWIVIVLSRCTIHTLRFSWIILPIITIEALTKSGSYSNHIAKYQSIKRSLSYWCNIKSVKHGILIFSIIFGPYIIETFLYYILSVVYSPAIFIIRFGWLLLFIIICEKLKDTDNFRKYRSIKRKLHRWCSENRFNNVLLICPVIFGPYIIETVLYYSFVIITSILFILYSPVIFIIRFGWLLLFIIICEKLKDTDNFRKYRSIKRKLHRWCSENRFNNVLLICPVIFGPYIIETVLYYSFVIITSILFILYSPVIFIIRFGWLLLFTSSAHPMDSQTLF